MFEYAQNRFIAKNRIVTANIYDKENVIKVAISVDTVNAAERMQYSGVMQNIDQARAYIAKMAQD